MSKKLNFINWVKSNTDVTTMPEDVAAYWNIFVGEEENKPMFTDNGKLILNYMRNNAETEMMKSKDIAEGLFVSSRMVSGAIRKLVNDGYVEKVSSDPAIYSLTDLGKTVEII